MTPRRGLAALFRSPRSRGKAAATPDAGEAPGDAADANPVAEIQVFAHEMIADLFAAGLRIQNLVSRAPAELQDELDDIAEHIDKTIADVRTFAFSRR